MPRIKVVFPWPYARPRGVHPTYVRTYTSTYHSYIYIPPTQSPHDIHGSYTHDSTTPSTQGVRIDHPTVIIHTIDGLLYTYSTGCGRARDPHRDRRRRRRRRRASPRASLTYTHSSLTTMSAIKVRRRRRVRARARYLCVPSRRRTARSRDRATGRCARCDAMRCDAMRWRCARSRPSRARDTGLTTTTRCSHAPWRRLLNSPA